MSVGIGRQAVAMMRRYGRAFLTDSCTIERQSQTSEGGYLRGGWSVVAADVACRMLPGTRQDARGVVEDKEVGRVYFKLSLAHDTDLRDGDRVVMGGVVYEVLQILAPLTDQVFMTVKLARLD
ncbi:MAG: hypothetical protein MUF38_06405 [Anaerolineae bacterium]|nr:hypothetical protein [Anaerolineae bacterium]